MITTKTCQHFISFVESFIFRNKIHSNTLIHVDPVHFNRYLIGWEMLYLFEPSKVYIFPESLSLSLSLSLDCFSPGAFLSILLLYLYTSIHIRTDKRHVRLSTPCTLPNSFIISQQFGLLSTKDVEGIIIRAMHFQSLS